MDSVPRLVRAGLVAALLALGLAVGQAQTIPGVAARVNPFAASVFAPAGVRIAA